MGGSMACSSTSRSLSKALATAEQPLVSIVMPSLNQAAFIEAAIDSVLQQDYPHIELIVSDGGSTDGTLEILRRKQAADPRLQWNSEEDSGPADALNKGFAKVRGTIIGWLNSDDLYTEGAISRAVGSLNAAPDSLMTYGHGQHIDGSGAFISDYPTLPPDTPVEKFADGCFICQPTVFFKRSMRVILGELDTRLKAPFDFDYWLRAFLSFPGRIQFVDKVQAYSRLHDSCITQRMRRTVAVEGMQVIARHLGHAPGHWLLTYINEFLALPPESRSAIDPRSHIDMTLAEIKGSMLHEEWEALRSQIAEDQRLDAPAGQFSDC